MIKELTNKELQEVNGGIFPLVIGGIVITKSGAAALGVAAAGLGTGLYFGSKR